MQPGRLSGRPPIKNTADALGPYSLREAFEVVVMEWPSFLRVYFKLAGSERHMVLDGLSSSLVALCTMSFQLDVMPRTVAALAGVIGRLKLGGRGAASYLTSDRRS